MDDEIGNFVWFLTPKSTKGKMHKKRQKKSDNLVTNSCCLFVSGAI